MGDLGIGSGELLLILVVVLIIFGPSKIPEIARGVGKTMHAFRKASSELTNAVTREIEAAQKQQPVQKAASKPELTESANHEKEVDGPGANI